MTYGDFKDLPRKTALDKILHNKAFNVAKNPKHDEFQRGLTSMVYKFFDKKTSGANTSATRANKFAVYSVKSEVISNQELAKQLQKTIIRKSEKRKVHSSFIDNILGSHLADMQLINKFDNQIRFLLCVIDTFNKYSWVVPLKYKKGTKLLMLFKKL